MGDNMKGICEVLPQYPPGLNISKVLEPDAVSIYFHIFFFQDLFSFSFVPTRSCIDIIFYEGTMHASCLVWQKSSVLMGTFKIICWPQPFLNSAWFSPFLLFEKKMRGYNKNSPWQSRTIRNYDDCTAELMFDVSIPYIVISIKWKRERLNAALITWDPIGRLCFPKCNCLDHCF